MIVVDPISVPSPGNLPPSDPADFDFERSSRLSASHASVPLGGIPRAMREAAEGAGLDPLSELYNEALRYAQEGHLRLARERLQMLLCMGPDDGEARLMLARVHVAGQRWTEALAALDEAANCGVSVPQSLRRAVEDHLQADQASREEQRSAVRAREQGEVKSLRGEARRLRSDNAQLTGRLTDLEREVRKWAWATAGVSMVAILFVSASLLFGGRSAAQEVPQDAVAVDEAAQDDDVPGVAEAPNDPAAKPAKPAKGVAARAGAALDATPGLAGASVELKVKRGVAIVAGSVPTFKQRKTVERTLQSVDGVDEVNLDGLAVLSRTQGTTHVVASGDTLSHIAYAYYGESTLTKPITEANGVDAKGLRIGQVLTIPAVE